TDDLCHEHVNYFNPTNARRLLAAQAFPGGDALPTAAGNEMHVWGYFDATRAPAWPASDRAAVEAERMRLADFAGRATAALNRRVAAIDAFLAAGRTVGLYAGGHTAGSLVRHPESLRYYDGDEWKHGKCWLPELQAIRSPNTLRDDPVDVLIVSPDHHFSAIARHLHEN